MALDFRMVHLDFLPISGRTARQSGTAVFGSRVTTAQAVLRGFDIRYTDGDHHILRQQISPAVVAVDNNVVTVSVDFLLRDNSGDIDDRYSGSVDVLVFANVA